MFICIQIICRILEKTALVDPNCEEWEALKERLELKIREGKGECMYEVGIAEHTGDSGTLTLIYLLY